jgi:hypothetical protein
VTLARAVEAIAPGATPVPGGFRFRIQDVAVSVLADEAAGLLRVVARAGELTDREVRLVVSALRADMLPDFGARVVSVRGLMCSAVLAPLRGLTEAILQHTVDGAVLAARVAARTPDPAAFGEVPVPAGSSDDLVPRPDGGLSDAIDGPRRAPDALE